MINEGGSKFDAKGGSVLDANQQIDLNFIAISSG